MTTYEIVSLFISGVGAIFVGVSLLLLVKQLKLIVLAHEDNHEWNRRIATHQAIDKVRNLNKDNLNRKFGYINRKEPIPLKEINKAFKEDPALQLTLHNLLNLYEGLANGVFLGTYDEATIRANRKTPMESILVRFRLYIQHRRDGSSKTAWIGFERLITGWNTELSEAFDREQTGKIK